MDRILKIIENSKRNFHEFKILQGFNESLDTSEYICNESLDTSEYIWEFSNFEVFNGISNLKTKTRGFRAPAGLLRARLSYSFFLCRRTSCRPQRQGLGHASTRLWFLGCDAGAVRLRCLCVCVYVLESSLSWRFASVPLRGNIIIFLGEFARLGCRHDTSFVLDHGQSDGGTCE